MSTAMLMSHAENSCFVAMNTSSAKKYTVRMAFTRTVQSVSGLNHYSGSLPHRPLLASRASRWKCTNRFAYLEFG